MSNTIQLFDQSYNVGYHYEGLTTISELETYLPITDSARYDLLQTDIEQNGVNDPILYYIMADGIKLVLDGHSRLKACIELNLANIPTKEIKEDFESLLDIQFWMVKNQCQRRNFTPIEKLQLACLHEEAIAKKAKENLVKAGRGDDVDVKVDTILEIAKLADVSRTTVAKYRKVLKKGSDKLINKMLKGDVSITSAYMQTQSDRKKKSLNPNVQIDTQQEIQTELELENAENEIFTVKYVQDIHEGRHLLVNNEIECFIMTKDDSKIKNTMYQHPNLKYAVFVLE